MKQNWPLLVTGSLLAVMVFIGFGEWPRLPQLPTDEWAAVVQAIGSILAIIASAWLAILAPQHAENERFRASQARRVLALLTISQEVAAVAEAASILARSKSYHANSTDHIRAQIVSTQSELNEIGGVDFPPSLRIHLIRAKAASDVVDRMLERAGALIDEGKPLADTDFDKAIENAKKVGERLQLDLKMHPIGKAKMKGFV